MPVIVTSWPPLRSGRFTEPQRIVYEVTFETGSLWETERGVTGGTRKVQGIRKESGQALLGFVFGVIFFDLYHGKSPFITTISGEYVLTFSKVNDGFFVRENIRHHKHTT